MWRAVLMLCTFAAVKKLIDHEGLYSFALL